MDEFLKDKENIKIVTYKFAGTSDMAYKYAKEKGFPVKVFDIEPADSKRQAIYRRNRAMLKYAEDGFLVAFWSGRDAYITEMIKSVNAKNISVKEYTVKRLLTPHFNEEVGPREIKEGNRINGVIDKVLSGRNPQKCSFFISASGTRYFAPYREVIECEKNYKLIQAGARVSFIPVDIGERSINATNILFEN